MAGTTTYTTKFMNFGSDIPVRVEVKEPTTGKLLIYDTLIKVSSACPSSTTYDINMGCDTAFDGAVENTAFCISHNLKLGTVGFASTSQNLIPAANGAPQTIWSDVVVATGCNKSTISGGDSAFVGYYSDCRRSSSGNGDYFSLCAVFRYGHALCPAPWRVPTEQDFVNLDLALGGSGANRTSDATTLGKYMNPTIWGGAYGGYVLPWSGSTSEEQGNKAYYWSSKTMGTSQSDFHGQCLYFDNGNTIEPKSVRSGGATFEAYPLRCVRD
jgi:uncharacterized protein (TIGR02145 family)